MIFFATWLLLFFVVTLLFLLLRYWFRLFSVQESYHRHEILDITSILPAEINRLLEGQNTIIALASFFVAVALSWFLVFLGGAFTPSVPPVPDFAVGGMANYFFQSFLILIVVFLIMPLFRDLDPGRSESPAAKIADSRPIFLLGMGSALSTISLATWGVYHESSFLFALFNTAGSFAMVLFALLRSASNNTEESAEEEEDDWPGSDAQKDYPDEGEDRQNDSQGSTLADELDDDDELGNINTLDI